MRNTVLPDQTVSHRGWTSLKLANKKPKQIAPAMLHIMGISIIAQGVMQVNSPRQLDGQSRFIDYT
ncbi:hypothetical protein OZL46_11240 [Bacillus sonorensis]|uniref:hypothetical protein n=1 Tax=Bacillus sonorensis TaxID=119858 RepID=UPI00228215AC|nr:hypothetical protein [Bacillus sonorensis]MCZ0068999.1 hypothetical protein [Bacillus sonorensis]MCZ0096387.1 hypothetical protein [Bacillus sonorensis]MEC1519951.1 hypothetical protein [Bacillus sonorensis]